MNELLLVFGTLVTSILITLSLVGITTYALRK